MKAILIDEFVKDFASLRPQDVPPPKPKSERDVRVKITHAAITHVDLLYAQGLHQNNKRHMKPPFILGNELVGEVISSPKGSSFRKGDRVFGGTIGSYAEESCVPEATLRKVPQNWTNEGACAVGASGAVSYGALISVAQVQPGETVLVLGASGGLGVMAVQIAKAVGARVIAVVGGAEKAHMIKQIGADAVVDYRDGDGAWEDRVKELTTDGRGVDVVYDGIGAVVKSIRCLRYRGRIVLVGFAARGGQMEDIPANKILLKGARVYGYRFGEDGRHDPQRPQDIWDGFMKLVEAGSIQPVVYKEEYRGLEAIPRAFEDTAKHKTWGRAILTISESSISSSSDGKAKL